MASERVEKILKNYPILLAQFKAYLPKGHQQQQPPSSGLPAYLEPSSQESRINHLNDQPMADKEEVEREIPNFHFALNFVNSVKARYAHNPHVYDTFLALMKNFQRGILSEQEVISSVSGLLSSTPDLVSEFKNHYAPKNMVRVDSNDTVAMANNDQNYSLSFAQSSMESEPLLGRNSLSYSTVNQLEAQPVESQAEAVSLIKQRKPYILALVYVSLFALVAGLGAAAYFYFDWSFISGGL